MVYSTAKGTRFLLTIAAKFAFSYENSLDNHAYHRYMRDMPHPLDLLPHSTEQVIHVLHHTSKFIFHSFHTGILENRNHKHICSGLYPHLHCDLYPRMVLQRPRTALHLSSRNPQWTQAHHHRPLQVCSASILFGYRDIPYRNGA